MNKFGDFTVTVSAPGCAEARKDVTVDVTGRTQVDFNFAIFDTGESP